MLGDYDKCCYGLTMGITDCRFLGCHRKVGVKEPSTSPQVLLIRLLDLQNTGSISFPLYCGFSLEMASAMGPLSPSTSPRLPSPPPFPEVQIGLRSPRMNAASSVTSPRLPNPRASSPELPDTPKLDDGPTRRIRPGTKAADMASGPPLVPLAEVRSPKSKWSLFGLWEEV